MALGESLRLDHFWLGVEFLLMSLSRQHGCVFPGLLREMGIDPREFRGSLRWAVGVPDVHKKDWRDHDVETLGEKDLPGIEVVDPHRLREQFEPDQPMHPIITSRMLALLHDAAKLAPDGQVGHNELLLATLQHSRSFAVQLFLWQARQAGWSAEQVLSRLEELLGGKRMMA
jgi:hypothetical protein